MKELFKENYRLFKASFKQVMLFELFYKAVFLVLFLPLSGFLLDATVKLSGFRYLTNENLYSYLKNPCNMAVAAAGCVPQSAVSDGGVLRSAYFDTGCSDTETGQIASKIFCSACSRGWLWFIRAMQGCC